MENIVTLQLNIFDNSLENFLVIVEQCNFVFTPFRVEFLLNESARMGNVDISNYLAKMAQNCTTAAQQSMLNGHMLLTQLLLDVHRTKVDINFLRREILPMVEPVNLILIRHWLSEEYTSLRMSAHNIKKKKIGPSRLR